MKKFLILSGILALSMTSQVFANDGCPVSKPCPKQGIERPQHPQKFDKQKFEAKRAEFDKKLNLTEEQKLQAKQIRQKGQEEMKPIMEKMKAKHEEIKKIGEEKLTVQERQEKIKPVKVELRKLDKQAREVRMKNMKEFESVLTEKQLKTLNKMKEQGRKEFAKKHKNAHKGRPIGFDDPKPTLEEK